MTKEEKAAIAQLNRALARCYRAGIKLCGMDDELLYCTRSVFDEMGEGSTKSSHGDYSAVARALNEAKGGTGTLDSRCYDDSGAW